MANTKFERVNNVEQIIEDIDALPEATTADKVNMFIQLCNHETLMNELKKQALLQKTGIVPENDVFAFAYGVLKLSCPHLFVEAG